MKKCCGTCAYHEKDDHAEDYVCVNDQSEEFADWTDFNHCCDVYEERE